MPYARIKRAVARPVALETLSASKLAERTDRLSALSSELCRAFINAGFGHVKGSDIRGSIHHNPHGVPFDMAQAYIAIENALADCHAELSKRRVYHGCDKPIRRRA